MCWRLLQSIGLSQRNSIAFAEQPCTERAKSRKDLQISVNFALRPQVILKGEALRVYETQPPICGQTSCSYIQVSAAATWSSPRFQKTAQGGCTLIYKDAPSQIPNQKFGVARKDESRTEPARPLFSSIRRSRLSPMLGVPSCQRIGGGLAVML